MTTQGQQDRILTALLKGETLTALAALKRFNCMRLAARVRDLRDKGWPIKTTPTKYGGKRFASYWMGKR